MIDFKCPHCGESMSVPDSLAGSTETCPGCGKSLVVPGEEPGATDARRDPAAKTALAGLVKLAAADEYNEAWKELADPAVRDDVVDLFMTAVQKGQMKWGSTNKLSRFLRDINAPASPDAILLIVENHRHKPGDTSETHLLGKAASNLLLLPQGQAKLRQQIPADDLPWVIAQGLLGCEEIEDSVKIGSGLTDLAERRAILQQVTAADVNYESFRARALAGLAPESIDLIKQMYSPGSEEAGGIGAALLYAVGGAEELKTLMGESAFEAIIIGAHTYGIGAELVMRALAGLDSPKAVERLTHALLNNDDRAIAPLVSLGKKAHPALLEDLRRSWQQNVDALVVYKKRILQVLSETADEDCIPAIRDAAGLHPELKMECEKLVRKIQGGEEKHTRELVATADIHTAVSEGDLNTVKLILEENPKLAEEMKDGCNPLHTALDTGAGHLDIAKVLIDHGADVTSPNPGGVTPLHLNSLTGNCEVAELLISRGASIDAVNPNDGSTPLHLAALQGKTDLIALLLSKGANINAKEKKYGIAAVQFAAVNGHTETLEFLISKGADLAIRDNQGRSPQELAAQQNRPESVAILRKHTEKQATGRQKTLDNELFAAVATGNTPEVGALLDRGANATARDANGDTPLHNAAQDKDEKLDCCRVLLEKGADANAKNDKGQTPLEQVIQSELIFRASMQAAFGGFGDAMSSEIGNEKLMPLLALFKKHNARKPGNLDSAFWNEVPGGKAAAGGCFIATACCGSEDCWQVSALRQFRDERLATSCSGRKLVAAYYRLSPPLARLLGKMPLTRFFVRCFAITPLSYAIARTVNTPNRRNEPATPTPPPECPDNADAQSDAPG
ncbi:MAG: ankyrin repeat domain-containing protein [Phycisphaerae bacterium]|nr:ankyrin repeat domain-containing protein [Phycisphaerae bacterium]